MKYYPLNQLQSLSDQNFTWSNAQDYLNQFSDDKIKSFIRYVDKKNASLYLGWIELNQGLKEVLVTGRTKMKSVDTSNISKHSELEGFRSFVTPFLANTFLTSSELNFTSTEATYLFWMAEDERAVLEAKLYEEIDHKLKATRLKVSNFIREDEVTQEIHSLLSDDIIAALNGLSRRSYALKRSYIDDVLAIIKSPGCTVRLANWILKRIELITLNEEHKVAIETLRSDLKSGRIKVKNTGFRSSQGSWKTRLMAILLIGIGLLTFWLIYFKPYSDKETIDIATNSSFKEFTKEERMSIDSLLTVIQPDRTLDGDKIELPDYAIGDLDLVLRSPFKNNRAEQFYQDVLADINLFEGVLRDTCQGIEAEEAKTILPPETNALQEKSNGQNAFIRNESVYACRILVFQNNNKSPLFYGYLPPNETANFKLAFGDYIIALPGNELVPFEAPKNSVKPLPSEAYRHHFCVTDLNYKQTAYNYYEVTGRREEGYKLLLVGTEKEAFQMVDIHNILTEH